MKVFISLLVVVPLSLGANILNALPGGQGQPIKMNKAPNPCCSPDQYEGLVSGLVGLASDGGQIIADTLAYSYDRTNRRTNMNGTTIVGGKASAFRVLTLFDEKREYIVDGEGTCTYVEAGEFVPSCIPDNATYYGRFRNGMEPATLEVDSWSLQAQGYTVLVTATPSNCVIVSQVAYGSYQPGNVGVLSVFGLVNPTSGIKDPGVFTPPSHCQPGNSQAPRPRPPFSL